MKGRIVTEEATYEHAEKNFVRLHVFYDDLKEGNIEQEKAYEIYNFIGT